MSDARHPWEARRSSLDVDTLPGCPTGDGAVGDAQLAADDPTGTGAEPGSGVETGGLPDSALVAACAAFDALERRRQRIWALPCDAMAAELAEIARASLGRQQRQLLSRILGSRAVTREGLRAKAVTLALWDGVMLLPEETYWNVMLTRSLVADALGVDLQDKASVTAALRAIQTGVD